MMLRSLATTRHIDNAGAVGSFFFSIFMLQLDVKGWHKDKKDDK
jgi:hypothetical protein